MNTDIILTNINSQVTLSDQETEFLKSVVIARPFKQGELIVRAGDPARYLMFVNSGYLMTYFTDAEGKDHVVQFATNGWWAPDLYSLSKEPNTPYSTRGLCDGELLLIPRLSLDQMFRVCANMDRYFRIQFQNTVIRHQGRILKRHTAPAEERYQEFIDTYLRMEQYVAQKYIASYLGITPEFLSKVRSKMARKIS